MIVIECYKNVEKVCVQSIKWFEIQIAFLVRLWIDDHKLIYNRNI